MYDLCACISISCLFTVGYHLFSIVSSVSWMLKCFQPGESPRRSLLRDCEIFAKVRLKLYCPHIPPLQPRSILQNRDPDPTRKSVDQSLDMQAMNINMGARSYIPSYLHTPRATGLQHDDWVAKYVKMNGSFFRYVLHLSKTLLSTSVIHYPFHLTVPVP